MISFLTLRALPPPPRAWQAVDRDRSKLDYHRSLKRRFGHMDEVRRISKYGNNATGCCCGWCSWQNSCCCDTTCCFFVWMAARHRHVPTAIKKAKAQAQLTAQSQKRKKANRVRHSKPGTVKTKREREKQVVRELP